MSKTEFPVSYQKRTVLPILIRNIPMMSRKGKVLMTEERKKIHVKEKRHSAI